MERYFLIFYTGNIQPSGQQIGHLTHISYNGKYPNANGIVEWLKEQNPQTQQFVITNLIELNKDDFEHWTNQVVG